MNASTIHPVLLCGGSGTRLWPVSRKRFPKQFGKLIGDRSLFEASVSRLSGEGFAAPLVVTGEELRFLVLEQLAHMQTDPAGILIEPEGKNTAPAILAAALWLQRMDPEALMLVAPTDHIIPDGPAFQEAVKAAAGAAKAGALVTFGIAPTRAETGYGWLELADGADQNAAEPQDLARFVEKPQVEKASEMLNAGNFLWNAGIFLMSAASLLDAFEQHQSDMLKSVRAAVDGAERDLGFERLSEAPWSEIKGDSIDYAIMERADNLKVMPYSGVWSDLGGWEAIWQESGPDADGNAVRGAAQAIECEGSLLRAESDGQELVGIGLKDIVAVAMPDAVLVAHKSHSQKVKEAVSALKASGKRQAEDFPVDRRPWGWFESLAIGGRFQVKRLVVVPGGKLSLQSHMHRSEHWIVVEGTARVTIDENVQLVGENQSVYIPMGSKHRLENPGKVPMVLIEVQTGSYLGEDDIHRYDDVYARK